MTHSVQQKVAEVLRRSGYRDVLVREVRALSGGASSETAYIDAIIDGACQPLILQRAAGDSPAVAMSKSVQAELQRLVHGTGLPVANVVAILQPSDELGDGYVMGFIDGETLPGKYLKSAEFASARIMLGDQCATALAHLHEIPSDLFRDLPLIASTPAELVQHLFELYAGYDTPSPAFDLAFAWTRRHAPVPSGISLVHGDFRSGNLIVQKNTGLAAILDWELAHLGNPLEDLGWICVNSWRFGHWQKPVGGFADRAAFYAAYEKAAGKSIDLMQMFFWEVYGTLRWGISCLQLVHQHLSGDVVSVERAAIGRRISEVELDLMYMLKHGTI